MVTLSFTVPSMIYPGINITREVKAFHRENFNSLKKEIEEGTRRGEDFVCLWIGRINIVKMTILLKTIHRFSEILLKTPMTLFTEIKKSPKTHMEVKKKRKKDPR